MRRVDSAPLRDRLVTAGVELLEADGLANLSLRAITRRTGVSHGAPRRYFPTHNTLLAAIAATGLADLATRLRPADSDARTTPADQLTRLGVRYLEFAEERPAMFELMFRHDLLEGAGGNLRETSLPLFAAIVELVEAASPGTTDARPQALGIWTNLHGLAVLRANRSLELVSTVEPASMVARVVQAHLSRPPALP